MPTMRDRTTGAARVGTVLLVVVAVGFVVGCTADPISPSEVTGLRFLGLEPSPPQPAPGEPLTLEMVWTDPRPSCTGENECPLGQSCQDGVCLRDNDEVEIIWLVVPISNWQSTDVGLSGLFSGNSEDAEVEEAACQDIREAFELFCLTLSGCFPVSDFFGSEVPASTATPVICCGDERAARVSLQVPEGIEVPEPTCAEETSLDTAPTLQVQTQLCIGGELDLCQANVSSLSFGCTGEGAETITATSRVSLAWDSQSANLPPEIDDPRWGHLPNEEEPEAPDTSQPWQEGTLLTVQGCQGNGCASRHCRSTEDCQAGQHCADGLCREELSLVLIGGAQETYLRPCDEPSTCQETADCPTRFVCDDGTCRRIENPVTAFFATDGAFTPGRVVLDTTGDGRPNDERFVTHWLPPTLDPCEAEGDECSFGTCDPEVRLCTGDVSFWVVARDGRGGQDWIERTARIVP